MPLMWMSPDVGSINRSIALAIDTGGDDVYEADEEQRRETEQGLPPGYAMTSAGFRARAASLTEEARR